MYVIMYIGIRSMRVLVRGGIVVIFCTFFVLLFPSIVPPLETPYDYKYEYISIYKNAVVINRYIGEFHV